MALGSIKAGTGHTEESELSCVCVCLWLFVSVDHSHRRKTQLPSQLPSASVLTLPRETERTKHEGSVVDVDRS